MLTPPRTRIPLGFPGAPNVLGPGAAVMRGPFYRLKRYHTVLRLDVMPWWRRGSFRPSPRVGRLVPMAHVHCADGARLVRSIF